MFKTLTTSCDTAGRLWLAHFSCMNSFQKKTFIKVIWGRKTQAPKRHCCMDFALLWKEAGKWISMTCNYSGCIHMPETAKQEACCYCCEALSTLPLLFFLSLSWLLQISIDNFILLKPSAIWKKKKTKKNARGIRINVIKNLSSRGCPWW